NQLVMDSDIALTDNDSVDLIGTPGAHCLVVGNNHRFIVPDASWTGAFRAQYVDFTGVGTATLDLLGGTKPGDYAYLGPDAFVYIHDSAFSRSSGFNLYTGANSYIVFSRNTYNADNLVPADGIATSARPWFKEYGTSTAAKTFQGNRVFRAWVDV